MARSSLRPATASAGSSTAGEISTSTTSSVEAIKSELGATETSRGTVISLPGDVLFDFDKAAVREDARPVLDKLAQLLVAESVRTVTIEGHTDSKGDDAYNLKLSKRRAQAVRDYLKDVRSIAAERMTVKGVGEARPVGQNMTPDGKDNPSGQQKNRRVEVIIAKG